MPNETKPTDENTEAQKLSAEQREEIQSIVNGALGAHQKRTEKLLKDSMATMVSQLQPKPAEQGAEGDAEGQKPAKGETAEIAALRRRVEAAEKKHQEAENLRAEEAKARRNDSARTALRRALENDFRPEALDLLVDAFQANGTLRFDDDGNPQLAVKRARTKGGATEEQIFDDIAQGITDWKQRPDAAVFLKPATPAGNNAAGNQGRRPAPTGPLPTYDKPTTSVDEINRRVLESIQGGS